LAKLRNIAHWPQTLVFAKRFGQNGLRQIYRKAKNLRMSPLTITAIVAYLESRRSCSVVVVGETCEPLADAVEKKLDSLYAKAMTNNLKDEGVFKVGARESGGFFHIAMLALKHLEYEVETAMEAGTGVDANYEVPISRPIDVEQLQKIALYTHNRAGQVVKLPGAKTINRYIDIVVQEAGQDLPDFIEVKSWQSPLRRERVKQWKYGKAGNTHRQYFLDRSLIVNHSDDDQAKANRIYWRFQKFNRKSNSTVQSLTAKDLQNLRKAVHKLPGGDPLTGVITLGLGNNELAIKVNNSLLERNKTNGRIQTLSVKTWMLEKAREFLLKNVTPENIADLIENEAYE
jgi:hypothetical protein